MRRAARVLLFAAIAAAACSAEPRDAQLTVRLLRGDADPFDDPGSAERGASPVGSLELRWKSSAGEATQVVALDGSAKPSTRLAVAPGEGVLSVRGLRSSDGALFSAGRSLTLKTEEAGTLEATLFLGPVEAFTPVGPPMPGPRMRAVAAPLGQTGALLVGGWDLAVDGTKLASPSLVVYRLGEGRACGPDEGCLTGVSPQPRREAIACALPDGSVVHGLGMLANGSLEPSLYRTNPAGITEALALVGDPLPGLAGAAAVALPDGAVLVIGGWDASGGPTRGVYRVDVATARVMAQPVGLSEPRAFAAAALLASGAVLVAGGEGAGVPLSSAEVYQPGVGSGPLDGGSFPQVRTTMRGPRVSPAFARLSDDAIVLAGGGTDSFEVFREDLGVRVGGLVDMVAPPDPLRMLSPALLRIDGGALLAAGGEPEGSAAGCAAIFTPDPDQVLGPTSPVYSGTWRAAAGSATPRADPSLVELADGSVLFAGGGIKGVITQGGPNPGATRVEVLVPAPAD